MAATAVTVHARAKVNLALHVTGLRADGYHELDSIVMFASLLDETGDTVTVRFGSGPPKLSLGGPFAAAIPDGEENSALAAARAVGGIAGVALHKGLPVASGIGGSSADAAAVLAAARVAGADVAHLALPLGADVPVCLAGVPCRMAGIGETIIPLDLPAMPALLVNPDLPVSTPDVFRNLHARNNPPLPALPVRPDPAAFAAWLAQTRNDLEPAALDLAPPIGEVLGALVGDSLLARMSGSGATCFALYESAAIRDRAAQRIAEREPGWWVRRVTLEDAAGADAIVRESAAPGER